MAFLRAFNFSHGLTQPQLPPTLVDPFMGTAANVFQNGASTFNRPVLSPDEHDIQQHQLRQLEQLQQLEQFQQMQQQNEQLHRLQSRPRNRPPGTPRLRKPIAKVEKDGESDLTPSQQVGKKQQETLDDLIKEQLPSLVLTPSTTTTTTGNTHNLPAVTPIQGPIFLRNNTVPVVPLYSYPILNNGTLLQIPILWTALSVALGLEIRGEIIRGLPCIKRLNQLYCPTAGNRYPSDSIARFIDENKALIRRMYGEFQTSPDMASSSTSNTATGSTSSNEQGRRSVNKRQANLEKEKDWSLPDFKFDPDLFVEEDKSFVGTILPQHNRTRRQSTRNNNQGTSNKVDACESTVEVVTPYWAANSAGKIRAIVNTQHFEQAIHQEVCQKTSTKRCFGECSCEQKYKWHRLLAYDPDNDCKGIFMDWFLFPSCCVCRCPPLP